jgi:hypothetical protein
MTHLPPEPLTFDGGDAEDPELRQTGLDGVELVRFHHGFNHLHG